MNYATVHNFRLPRIGMGTSALGRPFSGEPSSDAYYLSALRSALEMGYTHFDTAEMYSAGHSEELLGRAIREAGIDRSSLQITTKVSPWNLTYKRLLAACERSLRRLGMEYIDLYLIHWPFPLIPMHTTFKALNQLVRQGKIRHIGVSNFNVYLLKAARSHSETPIVTDQVPYNLYRRPYVRNGLLAYCQQNEILVTAYSPVGRGRLLASEPLKAIASAHQASPHQIALAWLVQQANVIAIPLSFDPAHQKENLAAADIQLTPAEIERLNARR